MLKLYHYKNSICTQKVFITLFEKGLDYALHHIDLFKNEQYDPDYLKINPKGVVPTLQHGKDFIVESTLICEYLDETFLNPSLMPDQPILRSVVRRWTKTIDETIFEATRELSFSAMFRERMKSMTKKEREKRFRNVGDPERRARFVSTFQEGVASHYVFSGIANFESFLKQLEKDLLDGRRWVVGDTYTLADIAITPFLARLEHLVMLDVWIDDKPFVKKWWESVKARPSFDVAIKNMIDEKELEHMQSSGKKIKKEVARHREEYLEKY